MDDKVSSAGPLEPAGRDTLLRYARDTWASLAAMTDLNNGLPADNLRADGTASLHTSISDIGAYLWSTLVVDRLGIIGHAEAVKRLERTLATLSTMERHGASGQFYNWYDPRTGTKLTVFPPTGAPLTPILSSVDNGWLATGLHVVATSVPEVSAQAESLFASMDFGFYYRPAFNRIAFFYAPDTDESPGCYDTIVSESRIASYIGIATGKLPAKEYFGAWRTFPAADGWCAQKTKPVGFHRNYLGVDVFEGAYKYAGMRIVPSWGGSMFEALMPALFVPEETWGPRSWGLNHPLTVAAHIHHGTVETGYGYWGFSPASIPGGGYTTYGVGPISMSPDDYPSNDGHALVIGGFTAGPDDPVLDPRADLPPGLTSPSHLNGVVTPHASFLALRWDPVAALANLARLEHDFPVYSDGWGFRDSVNVGTGDVSDSYLSLDQGIIMAAIGNALEADMLRRAFATPSFELALKPVISIEEFNVGPAVGSR